MEAQAWTAIGLLAGALVGTLFYLGNRMDAIGTRLDSRIDGLSDRIDGLSTRMDGLSSRMDGLSSRMDDLFVRMEEQGRELASQIYGLGLKLDEHLRRHAG